MSGYLNPLPTNPAVRAVYDGAPQSLSVPSLHIIGKADVRIANVQSESLARVFHRAQLLYHDKGHMVSERAQEKDAILLFLHQHLGS